MSVQKGDEVTISGTLHKGEEGHPFLLTLRVEECEENEDGSTTITKAEPVGINVMNFPGQT